MGRVSGLGRWAGPLGRLKGWRLQLPQTHLGDDLGRGAPGDLRTKLQVVYSTPLGLLGFPGVSDGKESACNAGDPTQFLGQEGPLKKGRATHSSTLAWRIPRTEEPDGLQSMGS